MVRLAEGLDHPSDGRHDDHGQAKHPAKPLPLRAECAVNRVGSTASSLLATFEAKHWRIREFAMTEECEMLPPAPIEQRERPSNEEALLSVPKLIRQLYAIVDVFSKNTVAASAIFFSLVVFIIWSFIPVLGYLLAKAIGAKGNANRSSLLIAGIIVALIENGLQYFNILNNKQLDIGTAVVVVLFFLIAYLPLNKQKSLNIAS